VVAFFNRGGGRPGDPQDGHTRMHFIHDDFLLETAAARELYHTHAKPQPILDYHCHLSPKDIADDRRFTNLFEIWLEGDHYKWRAMRAHGVDERFCTGSASPWEKFEAWAATVPYCLRNPLFHWTHLELSRYFGIADLLDASSAARVWAHANEQLQGDALTAHGILRRFGVQVVGTTDDPADELSHHQRIRASGLSTRVVPTFRPDRALDVHDPAVFNPWVDRLGAVADVDVRRFVDLLDALSRRHQAFHDLGGRLSDHGLNQCFFAHCTEAQAAAIFDRARAGQRVGVDEATAFASYLMRFFGRLDAEKGWTKQLHLGARRNANSGAVARLGRDTGYDSIGDWLQADALGQYLDQLEADGALPRTIVYNVNPAANYVMATMVGNFQDGRIAGKVQFGSGWWFLDQEDGMRAQMDALSNTGLLSHFVGMTTDSRSFMSYPRHEYFRRVLCGLVGRDVERRALPNRPDYLGRMIADICYGNAKRYFGIPGIAQ
jgi:glucuronate isomerase